MQKTCNLFNYPKRSAPIWTTNAEFRTHFLDEFRKSAEEIRNLCEFRNEFRSFGEDFRINGGGFPQGIPHSEFRIGIPKKNTDFRADFHCENHYEKCKK